MVFGHVSIDETNRASNASFNKDTVQGAKNELFIEGLDNRPHSSLRNRYGKRVWQSPIQKREELLEQAREEKELYHIRFIKKSA